MGAGCLVQAIGLALPFGGCAVGFLPGAILGGMMGLALLLVGSRMAHDKWICGHCRNRIESDDVTACPVCHSFLAQERHGVTACPF